MRTNVRNRTWAHIWDINQFKKLVSFLFFENFNYNNQNCIVIEFLTKYADDRYTNLLKKCLRISYIGKNCTITYFRPNWNMNWMPNRRKYIQNVPLCRVARLQTAFQRWWWLPVQNLLLSPRSLPKPTSSKKLDNVETTIKKMKLLWVKLEMNMFELVWNSSYWSELVYIGLNLLKLVKTYAHIFLLKLLWSFSSKSSNPPKNI